MTIGTANEEGTLVVTITVTDQDGVSQVPKTCTWTILDTNNTVINGKCRVPIVPLSASMEVGLKGDDLPAPYSPQSYIKFIVEGTYDTTINGVSSLDCPIRESETITINDIPGFTC